MTRILVTSDTHYGFTTKSSIVAMAKDMATLKPDAVVIAGDVGEVLRGMENFTNCLHVMNEETQVPVLVVLGNHDLWVGDPKEYNSLDLWETYGELIHDNGCFYLEEDNYILDDVAIVGSMLHYDYSAIDTVGVMAGRPAEWFMNNKAEVINDGRFFHGLPDDITFAKEIGEKFRTRLQEAQDDPKINSIIVTSHVPCMEQQMTRNPHSAQWARSTPYFGNLSHQDFIEQCSKVKHVASGHSHCGNDNTIVREGQPDIRVRNIAADYLAPTFIVCDV